MTETDETTIRAQVAKLGDECYHTLFDAYKNLYQEKRNTLPDTIVAGALIGALLHIAAAAAVGSGIEEKDFGLASGEAYKEMFQRAPRWG